ncbi:Protein outspread [Lucilia cuprina]|nr:Protein outspread [Lucilia cuprina]
MSSATSSPPTTATTTSTATRTSDCRKFSPNIFNKSKCSHCFRQREEHSAAALECNRYTNNVLVPTQQFHKESMHMKKTVISTNS